MNLEMRATMAAIPFETRLHRGNCAGPSAVWGEAGHAIGASTNSHKPDTTLGPDRIRLLRMYTRQSKRKRYSALPFETCACFRAQITMKSIAAVRIKTNLPVIVDKSRRKNCRQHCHRPPTHSQHPRIPR